MKPEKILNAMNDIDGVFLQEAREVSVPIRRSRRYVALIAAVITLMAITVTAFAAEDIAGWLSSFFTSISEYALSEDQIEYLKENEQFVYDTQEHNGYTVELISFLSSEDTVYLIFGVKAPSDVDLVSLGSNFQMDIDLTDTYGRSPDAITTRHMDDSDGLNHTINYICILEQKYYRDDSLPEWNVHVNSLHSVQYDKATNHHEFPVLAEGPWEFTIDLSKSDMQTIELITEPVQTLAIVPLLTPAAETVEKLTIKSFILSPLDAIITYDPTRETNARFEGLIENTVIEFHVYAIMKDGTFITLSSGYPSRPGEAKLLAETPIVLAEVDYILLADGTKLMVP